MIEEHKDTAWNIADTLGGVFTALTAFLWHSINEYGHVIMFVLGASYAVLRIVLTLYEIRNARRGGKE